MMSWFLGKLAWAKCDSHRKMLLVPGKSKDIIHRLWVLKMVEEVAEKITFSPVTKGGGGPRVGIMGPCGRGLVAGVSTLGLVKHH